MRNDQEDLIFTLDWMIKDQEFRRLQTGIDQPNSPELERAKQLYQELRDGILTVVRNV